MGVRLGSKLAVILKNENFIGAKEKVELALGKSRVMSKFWDFLKMLRFFENFENFQNTLGVCLELVCRGKWEYGTILGCFGNLDSWRPLKSRNVLAEHRGT